MPVACCRWAFYSVSVRLRHHPSHEAARHLSFLSIREKLWILSNFFRPDFAKAPIPNVVVGREEKEGKAPDTSLNSSVAGTPAKEAWRWGELHCKGF
jgi:hypothetical protein